MNIHQSLNRVLESRDGIGDLFYQTFLKRHPEVQRHFIGVDMQRQAILLTTALLVVEQFYQKPRAGMERYLEYLGATHQKLGIPQALYPKFCDAMLDTLERFHGSQWSHELAEQWTEALHRAIAVMNEGCQQAANY